MDQLKMDKAYAERYVNDGFSGGERKKTEILQMCMLEPKLTMLDEIDSGLDVDAVRIVSETVAQYHNENNSIMVITHHSEILQQLKPDFVHILIDGKIVKTGDASLIQAIEANGYDAYKGSWEVQLWLITTKNLPHSRRRWLTNARPSTPLLTLAICIILKKILPIPIRPMPV